MFVKSKMNSPAKYYKGADCVILKPNTVTFVDDTKVTAKELMDCYGQRIEVLSAMTDEVRVTESSSRVEKPVEEKKVVLQERKEDLTLKSLSDILKEIEEEKKEEVPEVKEEVKEEVPEVKEEVKEEVPEIKEEVPEIKEEVKEEVPEVKEEVPEVKEEVPEVKEEVPAKVTKTKITKNSSKKGSRRTKKA